MAFRRIRPREIVYCKANRNNRETKEEPLISGLARSEDLTRNVSIKKPGRVFRGFLWAREQEIVLRFRYAEPVAPNVLRENWCPA